MIVADTVVDRAEPVTRADSNGAPQRRGRGGLAEAWYELGSLRERRFDANRVISNANSRLSRLDH